MNNESDRVERVFNAAVNLQDSTDREAFLNAACHGDHSLRAELDKLLRHDALAGSFLSTPSEEVAATSPLSEPAERPGTQIGPYTLIEELGEGGMGMVFMALQKEPFRRKVALKIIKPGMDTRAVVARFAAEEQALAMMDHPNIAKVLDAGATESGRPYFVMEAVKGVPITEYCDENKLTTRERLELFIPLCNAVQHAHQKGIIHRDLKPSNILATLHDGVPVPKIIDFGIAKATNQDLTTKTLATGLGHVIGTPLYMSPEQAEHNGLDIDTRSDIYSLGVVLYELLTGSTPIERESFNDMPLEEFRRLICEQDPPRPSSRISILGQAATIISEYRKTSPKELSKSLRHELDWIVMKALEKDRTRRYDSASRLSEDIERYLADRPVSAGPPSAGYLLSKFVWRNRRVLAASAAIALALVLGTFIALWQALRAEAEKGRAQATLRIAISALDDTYSAIGDRLPMTVAMTEPARLKHLENAIRFYSEFTNIHAADYDLRYDRARALARLGSVQLWLGRSSDAEATQRDAIREFEQLTAESPYDPNCQLELAKCYVDLGNTLRFSAESAELFTRAISVLQLLQPALGNNRDYFSQLAGTCGDYGWQRWCAGNFREAEHYIRKAIGLYEAMLSDEPDDTQCQYYLAQTYSNLALTLVMTEHGKEAGEYFEKSISLHEQVLTQPPVDPNHRWHLCWTLNAYGASLLPLNRNAESHRQYRKSLGLSWKLIEEFPHVLEYRNVWHESYTNLGGMLWTLRRRVEAEEFFWEVLDLLGERARQWPTITEFQYLLLGAQTDFAAYLLSIGQTPDAECQFALASVTLAKLQDDDTDDPFNLAILARAHHGLGLSHWVSGWHQEAGKHFAAELMLRRRLAPGDPGEKNIKNHEDFKGISNMAWLLTTCPDTRLRDHQRALAYAAAGRDIPTAEMALYAFGMASYRTGNCLDAVQTLWRVRICDRYTACASFHLSMAFWQLGDLDQSQSAYMRASAWMVKNLPCDPELELFREEAAALLGRQDVPPSVSRRAVENGEVPDYRHASDRSDPKATRL